MAARDATPLLAAPAASSAQVPWETVKLRSRIALSVYAVLFVTVVGFSIYLLATLKPGASAWALVTSLIALGISIPLTAYDINAHVQNYISPLQRYYMCVLLAALSLPLPLPLSLSLLPPLHPHHASPLRARLSPHAQPHHDAGAHVLAQLLGGHLLDVLSLRF